MGVISIREVQTYHKEINQHDRLAEMLATNKLNASSKEDLQKKVYQLMLKYNCVDLKIIQRIKAAKSLDEAYATLYNYVLCKEGNKTLKGFLVGKAPFKGTAIRGMEVHSPRL